MSKHFDYEPSGEGVSSVSSQLVAALSMTVGSCYIDELILLLQLLCDTADMDQ